LASFWFEIFFCYKNRQTHVTCIFCVHFTSGENAKSGVK